MSTHNRDLINAIHSALSTDSTLASYVKRTTVADVGVSHKSFPFVTVANAPYVVKPLSSAEDIYTYTVEILAGSHCMNPATAFQGNEETGREGILQLARDIESVIRGNRFGGILLKPVSDITSRTFRRSDKSGMLWNAVVSFTCERWQLRQ